MVLTAAQRAKRYREKLKEKINKYDEYKKKERQRKYRKRVAMTKQQREKHLAQHREAQQRYREKLKNKADNLNIHE